MLVPGVVGISILFQGVQSVALIMSQEFGFTREIEDRVQAPCPVWLVAMAKVLSGAVQGLISAAIVLPIASVVHAKGVEAHITLHWWIIVTVVAPGRRDHGVPRPAARVRASSRATSASCSGSSSCRSPSWAVPTTSGPRLAPIEVGGWHWLQTIVLVNPLIFVNEGMRAAFTEAPHMHLYIIYPVLAGFLSLFLGLGLHNFRRRVLA